MGLLMIILAFLLFWFSAIPVEETARPATAPTPPAVQQLVPLTVAGDPVTTLAIDPVTSEARFAAGTESLYRADGTGDWSPAGTSPGTGAMIVDSRNPDALWAGSGEECYRGGGPAQPLLRSTDGGANWIEAAPVGFVPLASWDPGGVVIAHDCSGLQVSFDGGESWAMPEGLPLGSQITSFAVQFTPESAAGLVVLVGVTGEGGTSQLWRVRLSDAATMPVEGPLQTWFGHAGLAIGNDGAILLGAPQGVLRSEDGGETWATSRTGLESTTLEQDPIEVFPTDIEPGSFGLPAIVSSGSGVFVAGMDGVYALADGSDAWTPVAPLDVDVTSLAIEPGSGALLVETSEQAVLRVEPSRGA